MSFNFEINRIKYDSIGELWFEINDKKYDFKFQVCTPDCDDCSENLNAHYFVFTDSTYATVIDIADYIYEDYFQGGQDGLFFVNFIYNNIIIYIQNDSEISEPIIEYKYVKSQINLCDLDKIKKKFKFLSAF